MYTPAFRSGNIDVFHKVSPSDTLTGSEPHPFDKLPKRSRITLEHSLESETKCHDAVSPEYSHTLPSIENTLSFFVLIRRLDERSEEWMRGEWSRMKLRVELYSDKKWMHVFRKLHDFHKLSVR
jgi:hypothetical protein